jgi:hypothetical protein
VIGTLFRRRRAAEAQLAAFAASLEDERLDPARIAEAAAREYAPLAGTRAGDDIEALRSRFGSAEVFPLLEVAPPPPPSVWRRVGDALAQTRSYEIAPPERVRVRLPRRGAFALVDFRPGSDAEPPEAALLVSARAYSWSGPLPPRLMRIPALVWIVDSARDTPPRARSRRLDAVWVFALPGGSGDWRFLRFERWASAKHRRRGAREAEKRQMRDEVVLSMAAADSVLGTRIPLEIAGGLPDDPRAALLELALIDHAFSPDVIEAVVRRLLDLWSAATEGDAEALAGAADASASAALLEPPGHVLRAAELEGLEVLRVNALRIPPEVTVKLEVRAWRGPADLADLRDEGTRRARLFWWRLARQDSAELPWRLIDSRIDPLTLQQIPRR